jgi:ribosomal protein RSM22 (predicted rRNA methylase)
VEIRAELLTAGGDFQVIAPCTHSVACPLFQEANAKHWCHHFAEAPSDVSRDARWDEWSRELGIDRRSLPYSHLVLSIHGGSAVERLLADHRVPREGKGHHKILSCDESGLRELMLQKRDAPELYRALGKSSEYPPYRWQLTGGKISGAEVVPGESPPEGRI